VNSRKSDHSTKTAGTTSTCPQTALTMIIAGLKRTAAATSGRTGHWSLTDGGAIRVAKVPAIQARAMIAENSRYLRSTYPGGVEALPSSHRTIVARRIVGPVLGVEVAEPDVVET
jgi:hypothetical protein